MIAIGNRLCANEDAAAANPASRERARGFVTAPQVDLGPQMFPPLARHSHQGLDRYRAAGQIEIGYPDGALPLRRPHGAHVLAASWACPCLSGDRNG
ncbi:hypothetical protein PX699_15640 [Sphingobium sp. H39-3-25]|uniref:hypothetical protein n=1 Tax=Sphingobium arseniciresistens TaxID=3030834 RepID=UPI0023BA35DD|nr:hypothetical protein [Sphingobium arseniciresistens]